MKFYTPVEVIHTECIDGYSDSSINYNYIATIFLLEFTPDNYLTNFNEHYETKLFNLSFDGVVKLSLSIMNN